MKKPKLWKGNRFMAHLKHERRKHEGSKPWRNHAHKYYEHEEHLDARGNRTGRRI
jgi:hypothetical protein